MKLQQLVFLVSLHVFLIESGISEAYSGYEATCSRCPAQEGQGALSTPHYPSPPTAFFCCIWVLGGRAGYNITLSIPPFELPNSRGCHESHIIITPGSDYQGGSSNRFCGPCSAARGLSYTFATDHVVVVMRYNNSSHSVPNKGVQINYALVSQQKQLPCGSGQFECLDHTCIPSSWKCNQVADCKEGEDELACSDLEMPLGQPVKMFNITNPYGNGNWSTPCYPHSYMKGQTYGWMIWVPQGKIEIRFLKVNIATNDTLVIYDGSTRATPLLATINPRKLPKYVHGTENVVYIELQTTSFYEPWEENASFGVWGTYQTAGVCIMGQNKCRYNESYCYTPEERCNGVWDCPLHGGDERGCGTCREIEFACDSKAPRSQCYTENERCTGIAHCAQGTDEQNCTPDLCGPDHGTFLCKDFTCIYEKYTCDGSADCPNKEDEDNCSMGMDRKVITAAVIGSLLCGTLLVVALGIITKLHNHRTAPPRNRSRYISPIGRIQQEILARQSAPPLYDEAMRTSRPYDEMMTILQQMLGTDQPVTDNDADDDDDDDELLDISVPRRRPQPDGSSLMQQEGVEASLPPRETELVCTCDLDSASGSVLQDETGDQQAVRNRSKSSNQKLESRVDQAAAPQAKPSEDDEPGSSNESSGSSKQEVSPQAKPSDEEHGSSHDSSGSSNPEASPVTDSSENPSSRESLTSQNTSGETQDENESNEEENVEEQASRPSEMVGNDLEMNSRQLPEGDDDLLAEDLLDHDTALLIP